MSVPTVQQLRGLFFSYWWIAALAIFLLALGWYLFFGGPGRQDKLQDEIAGEKGVNAALINQIGGQQNEVNRTENESSNGEANFNTSVNTDSGEFHGDSTDAFCRRFKCDSTCFEWRKVNAPHLFCKGDAER